MVLKVIEYWYACDRIRGLTGPARGQVLRK
jgi:hypothetical protein